MAVTDIRLRARVADIDTPFRRFARAYLASKLAVAGLVLLALVLFAAIAGPLLAPQNPYDLMVLDVLDSRLAPGEKSGDGKMTFLLGSDEQGRDMVSAILYGVRTSVMVGVVSTAIALAIGLSLGLWAAYLGGRTEGVIMRLVDIQLSFPPILIALILLALTGPGLGKIIVALVAVKWAYYARSARSIALVERRKEYIEAATCLGLSTPRIIFRHLLPNALAPVLVSASFGVASAILTESALSFLGFGVAVPTASWGSVLAVAQQYIEFAWWLALFPGLAIFLTVAAFNLIGDRLRDVLDPTV